MSSITVRQTVQKIVVDASTGAVSVISTGPQGPAGPPGTFPITFSDTPPVGPNTEDLWVNTDTFVLFGWVNDGDSFQWVEIGAIDIADLDLEALADVLVPYILNDPDFESGIGGGDTTPPTRTISTATHTLDNADIARLGLYDNAGQVTVTIPTATFQDGDWVTVQSLGAGGITFDTTGLTINGDPALPDLAQYEGLTIIFSDPNTINISGSGGGGSEVDLTPPTVTVSTTTYTMNASNVARLSLFDNAGLVTLTLPSGTFANGDWFTVQSLGAGGITFDTSGLVLLNGPLPDLTQYYGLTIMYSAADTISFFGGPLTETDLTPPVGVISTATHTLDTNDLATTTMFDNAAAVTVTVPTGTFSNGDFFALQSTGAGGLTLSTVGITINGNAPSVGIAENEVLLVIFTGVDTISVLGGTA